MESSPFYLLLFFFITSILVIITSKLFRNKQSKFPLPPGKTGWPIIGETLDFKRSNAGTFPESFVSDRMQKYSDAVFRTSLFGENMAVFCGPSGNKFLFSNEYKLVTSWWPRSMKKTLNFPSTSSTSRTSTREELTKKRRVLHEILKPEALRRYIPVMDAMAREHLATEWAPHSQVDVFALVKKYTFALACRIFLGLEDPDHVARLASPFAVLRAGYMSVPINIPGTTLNRSIKAGKIIRGELLSIIKERKSQLSRDGKEIVERDLLSCMLVTPDEKGKFMTEMEISNQIIGSLIASHHTTSTAIGFVLKYMAELPNVHLEVFKEQLEIARSKGPDDLLNWDDIQKMSYSWNVACEAMRLTPPAQGSFREATTDFIYKGFTIPKGWKTYWSTYSTHTNPKYFSNPKKFDPSRFEGNGPEPYTFVPFGGGPRICPGKEYARLEILVFIHEVVTRFSLNKVIADDVSILNSTKIAATGLHVCLQPLSSCELHGLGNGCLCHLDIMY